jgi:hypothetical protein
MVYQTSNADERMKLGWYINRLRSMEPAEVLHRFGEAARKRASRGRDEGWGRYPAPKTIVPIPGLRDRVLAASPEARIAIAAAADAALAGRFAALGREWPARAPEALFPPELWRLDPVTGGLWPGADTYCFDIDFRHDGARGDIKYVWEINRLQFLVALAADAVLTRRREPIAAIEAAVASWHAANPPFRGVGWASGIEVALRAISLVLVVSLVGPQLARDATRRIGEILHASAFWLPRYPSRYSSANNHLVAELAGEYVLAHALGRNPRRAEAGLVAESTRQILADGAPAEQTPTYGAFTAEMILLCAAIGRATGHPLPRATLDRLGAFTDFVVALGVPTPGYGDDDEGRLMTLGSESDYAVSVAAAIAGFLARRGPTPPPGDLRAELFGTPFDLDVPEPGLTTFPQGGLSVWHGAIAGRDARLTFDHGPLGYLSIAAHGHADALAVTLALDGAPVLVDPGTWLYGSGGPWRSWFRSTPAHNTLNLEGASQSVMSGAFNWSSKAMATLAESGRDPHPWLRASHDGYVKRFGRRVQRAIEIEEGSIAVTDQLLGGPSREAEIVFQLAPGLEAEVEAATVTVRRGTEPLLRLDFPPSGTVATATGEDRPAGGWVSPRFGIKLPATRLSWRGPVGEGAVTTVLTPLAPAAAIGA